MKPATRVMYNHDSIAAGREALLNDVAARTHNAAMKQSRVFVLT